jgi:hypothetical protein
VGRTQKANGYLLFVNGYLLFIDSGGFSLSGSDRRSEGACKLAVFLDQVLKQDGWGHLSFQKCEQPEASLITHSNCIPLNLIQKK